jgi:hypothetical protein
MKTYTVDSQVILHFGIEVQAKDEDDAVDKARAKAEKLVLLMREQPEDWDFDYGDVDEVD